MLGDGADAVAGRRSGAAVRVGARVMTVDGSSGAAPAETAITPRAQASVQACLGSSVAQTIVGPAEMGADSALGVGVAHSQDAPAGLQLRICGAPHLRRDGHAFERRLRERFGDTGSVIREVDITERDVLAAVIPADAVPRDELLALLGGGTELRRLAWR